MNGCRLLNLMSVSVNLHCYQLGSRRFRKDTGAPRPESAVCVSLAWIVGREIVRGDDASSGMCLVSKRRPAGSRVERAALEQLAGIDDHELR